MSGRQVKVKPTIKKQKIKYFSNHIIKNIFTESDNSIYF